MSTRGRSEDRVPEEGMYVCEDGCERRYYRKGDRFLTCSVQIGPANWTKVEEV